MKIIITEQKKLMEALRQLSPESSNGSLRNWLKQGRVLVDGVAVFEPLIEIQPNQVVSLGKRVHFADQGIRVLYEDRHLIVIDKPENLLTVGTLFDREHTAHTILKRRYYSQPVFPVHRLDRDCSGIMVFAYTKEIQEKLKGLFSCHDIEREYLALVEGVPQEPKGTWKSYLVEDAAYVVRSTTASNHQAKFAITHYERLKVKQKTTLLRLNIETGRKNQIRVHCSEAGHPILGDKKYGSQQSPFGRLCLHAHRLAFVHPKTTKRMSFESAPPGCFL